MVYFKMTDPKSSHDAQKNYSKFLKSVLKTMQTFLSYCMNNMRLKESEKKDYCKPNTILVPSAYLSVHLMLATLHGIFELKPHLTSTVNQ